MKPAPGASQRPLGWSALTDFLGLSAAMKTAMKSYSGKYEDLPESDQVARKITVSMAVV